MVIREAADELKTEYCGRTVEISPDVVSLIQGHLSTSSADNGGLLLGRIENGVTKVIAARTFDSEHAHGTSFILSDADVARFGRLYESLPVDERLGPVEPLGWYCGWSRGTIQLSHTKPEAENELFRPTDLMLLCQSSGKDRVALNFFTDENRHSNNEAGAPTGTSTMAPRSEPMALVDRPENHATHWTAPDHSPAADRVTGRRVLPMWSWYALATFALLELCVIAVSAIWNPALPELPMSPSAQVGEAGRYRAEVDALTRELNNQIARNRHMEEAVGIPGVKTSERADVKPKKRAPASGRRARRR